MGFFKDTFVKPVQSVVNFTNNVASGGNILDAGKNLLIDALDPFGLNRGTLSLGKKLFPGNKSDRVTSTSFSKTGFLKSDIESFKQSGQTLAGTDNLLETPKERFLQGPTQDIFNQIDYGADQEGVDAMANMFQARLEQIRQKRLMPGVLQTRGER